MGKCNVKKKKIYDIPMLAVRTCEWWQAVRYQANVFLDSFGYDDGGAFPWEKDESRSIFFADRLFFILSINNAIIFTRELNEALQKNGDNSINEIFQKFAPCETVIAHLRNMNIHADEYLEEIGKHQKDFSFTFQSGDFKTRLTAFHTFVDGNEKFMLGNVDIKEILLIFNDNIQQVKSITGVVFFQYSSSPLNMP